MTIPAFMRRPGGAFGTSWMALLILLSATSRWWLPYGINDQHYDDTLQGPSRLHWLGTDDLGRDILSRLFSSSGSMLLASLITIVVAFGLGIPAALWAAEKPRVQTVLGRVAEIIFALPMMIILLAVIGAIGVRTNTMMVVLGVLISPAVYRMLLGVALSLRQRLFVDAARVNGMGAIRVSIRHILPGMVRAIWVQVALLFAVSILIQAGLAFMGFGPQEPNPSWGGMINAASVHVYDAPWMLVPTGLALALTVIAANEIGDAIAATAPGVVVVETVRRRRTPPPAAKGAAPASAALSVRDLRVSVSGGAALVTDVSFDVEPGKVLGLVGESGCGKTMTALAVLGLLPNGVEIGRGEVWVAGRNLVACTAHELQRVRGSEIAFISQEPMVALDPMFSVAYQLMQPIRRLRGVGKAEARRIAAELLLQVGIVDVERIMHSYAHQLSGGMAQRVAIALALTGEPKVLIADEPTTALDVTVQAEILSLLRGIIASRGMSLVLVTHDLGVVADICDTVAVMYAGEIVETGAMATVLDHPTHPYAFALKGADPHVPAGVPVPKRLLSIEGSVPAPADWVVSCRFEPRCPFADAACRAPSRLLLSPTGGLVRCVRANELDAQASARMGGDPR